MAYFYSHLVKIELINCQLDQLKLTDHQKHILSGLIDQTLHSRVLDVICSKLADQERKEFMMQMSDHPEDRKIMEEIVQKVDRIEQDIVKVIEDCQNEFLADIAEVKIKKDD